MPVDQEKLAKLQQSVRIGKIDNFLYATFYDFFQLLKLELQGEYVVLQAQSWSHIRCQWKGNSQKEEGTQAQINGR